MKNLSKVSFPTDYLFENSLGACKAHPNYKVRRKPLRNCLHCYKLWTERLGEEFTEVKENASQWRNLALQFDRHRMQAMALIRLASNGEVDQTQLSDFAKAPPIPGHEITEKLAALEEIVDKAWNRCHTLTDGEYIPGALNAWKRPVLQRLPYGIFGKRDMSTNQYCNGWNDSGGYWKAYADDLKESLEAANDRAFRASEAHVVTMGKLKEAEGVINSLTKFPAMLRKMWSGGEVQRWINAHIKPNGDQLLTDSDRNPFYEGLFEGETEDERKSRLDHYNNPKGLIGYARRTELAPLLDERMPAGGYIHIGIDHPTLWAEDTAYAHLVPLFADQQSDVAKALNGLLMCPYLLEEATIPKTGINSAPDYQVVGTLHVSLTRHQQARKVLKEYYHRMGEGMGEGID